MRKLFILLIVLLPLIALAADDVLDTPKPLIDLEAAGIRSGFEVRGSADSQKVWYPYFWLNPAGGRIAPYNNRADGKNVFTCKDWDSMPQVAVIDCIADQDPDPCCDGPESGSCDDTFDNANCVGDGDPSECCTAPAEGVCDCWNDIKGLFGPVKNFLDGELDKWEDISRQ